MVRKAYRRLVIRYRSTTTLKQLGKEMTALLDGLRQCKDLGTGKALHRETVEAGCNTDRNVANALIRMYSKMGDMGGAQSVFDSLIHRDVVSWTCLMLGYVENGKADVALELFPCMDCEPDSVAFVAAVKACGALATEKPVQRRWFCLEKGVALHRRARAAGVAGDMFLASTLVDMYAKCRSMIHARQVFERMSYRSSVTWNCLLLGYVENGEHALALELFTRMDCQPQSITYVAAFKACTGLAASKHFNKLFGMEKGVSLHKQVQELGLEKDVFVANNLMDMYSKFGSMRHARAVFDFMIRRDVVSWNIVILGYVENRECSAGLDLFSSMNIEPDDGTYVASLKACAGLAAEEESERSSCLQKGIMFHKQLKERGFENDIVVSSTLVDMYTKCGCMSAARDVFNGVRHRDVVLWTCLILGYVENGDSSSALEMFRSMDCEPNSVTYIAALKACASLTALSDGKAIHAQACKLGMEQEPQVATALVNLYAKCGKVVTSEHVFNEIRDPDLASWNALIGGYSSLSDMPRVFSLAREIEEAGLGMDGVTFIFVLLACNHAGLVEEGRKWFSSMSRHGLSPRVEHYNCLVDMLGRANKLEEALNVIRGMPHEATEATWNIMLGACRKWNNAEIGKVAFDALVTCNTSEASPFVIMGHILQQD